MWFSDDKPVIVEQDDVIKIDDVKQINFVEPGTARTLFSQIVEQNTIIRS